MDEVGSTPSDDSTLNNAPINTVCLPSIKELEQRALTKTSPLGNVSASGNSGSRAVSNATTMGFSSGAGLSAGPAVPSSTPQLMLLSNLSKVNPAGSVGSNSAPTGDVNSMPHNALYLQNISNTNIPHVGNTGNSKSNNSGGILSGITKGNDNNVNTNQSGDGNASVQDVKRKRGRPRKV